MPPTAAALAYAPEAPLDFDPSVDPPEGTRVSEADYWALYYEHENGYEWNNGILEVKPVSDVLTYQIYAWLLVLLRFYLGTHHNARVIALETGFRLTLPGKVVIRKPDLGLVLDDNAVPLGDLDHFYHGTFDLCVEALSTSSEAEIFRDTEQKRREYEAAGVREYYILHHEPDWQLFYQRTPFGLYAPMARQDGIIRSSVVPGFQFRLADLQSQPQPETLIEDPVYAPFVLPQWQQDRAARVQAEQARQRAEHERQQAMQARQRAEDERQQAERRAKQAEERAQRETAEKAALLAELAKLRGGP
jgi:hypothetical protein